MMSAKPPLVIDCADWPNLLSNPPLLSSFQSGWSSIQLAHYCQKEIDLPEASNPRHAIVLPLGHQTVNWEYGFEGRWRQLAYREPDFARGYIDFLPADLPHRWRASSTVRSIEWVHCYLEPTFVAQIADESVNPDRVELVLNLKKADPLIRHISLALKSSLEADGVGNRFYADSLATAMAAHLLRHYSTRHHRFAEYEDGLSKQKLRQALEYIKAHLTEDLSLGEIATELEMSQYYFCQLFKRSTGMTPHQYLIRQRIERAKDLLAQPEHTIIFVAVECGFANQSHFARCFRQCTGMTPKEFRKS
jgi:AraC family transcriptional regulator